MVGRFSLSDQAYDTIKTQLLAGAYRPGARLDAAVLAERHFWSVTPVRAALHRLAGERFIDARPNEGFMAPLVTEASLKALYDLSWGLLIHALKIAAARQSAPGYRAPNPPSPVATAPSPLVETERLFAAMGVAGNIEYARAIVAVTERLRIARRLEPHLIANIEGELGDLRNLFTSGASGALDKAITTYHRRRGRLVPALVAMIQDEALQS